MAPFLQWEIPSTLLCIPFLHRGQTGMVDGANRVPFHTHLAPTTHRSTALGPSFPTGKSGAATMTSGTGGQGQTSRELSRAWGSAGEPVRWPTGQLVADFWPPLAFCQGSDEALTPSLQWEDWGQKRKGARITQPAQVVAKPALVLNSIPELPLG